jgi:hypothetical protein
MDFVYFERVKNLHDSVIKSPKNQIEQIIIDDLTEFKEKVCFNLCESQSEILFHEYADFARRLFLNTLWNTGNEEIRTNCSTARIILNFILGNNTDKKLHISDDSKRSELLDAFAWVSSIGEQFFDSSKTVEDLVDAYLKSRKC